LHSFAAKHFNGFPQQCSALCCWVFFCALVSANRVHVVKEQRSKILATCDDLEATFHNRIVTFRASLDENADAVSRGAQARMMMRTYGIIRTLRRASTCTWVIQSDNENLEGAREIVQILLAGNPCAQAARSELAVGASAETSEIGVRSLHRALTLLTSDTCEVNEEIPQQIDDVDVDVRMNAAEEDLQDTILELNDPQGAESAFVQTNNFRDFMKYIGVLFLLFFLLLACVSAAALIGYALAYGISMLVYWGRTDLYFLDVEYKLWGLMGGAAAGAFGLSGCAYQLYNNVFPRLTQ